ncbi:hypothetical protein K1719_028219 [Acacia pycnantha]|nr:hypothetical protein K1719_028219 [Acacia pycnantha]
MWPTVPQAKVSARVKPAGSPVCKLESLTSSFTPAVAFLFADGANPNLPANNIRLVDATIICYLQFNLVFLLLRVGRRRAQFEHLNHQNEGSSSLVSSQQESLKRGNKLNHGKEPSSMKRPRFVWTNERHAWFVEVVKQLGKDAVPHKIHLAMNGLAGLTRVIVASHLQKHRENEKKKGRELRERIMNNADGKNRLGINNRLLAPPVVSSSSYPSSVSEIRNQDQALGNPIGRSNMEQLADQNRSLGTSFEKSNMEQQSITHLISGIQQLYQNPGTQQLDHALSTSFERNNMEQQPDQTSYDLYAPIRSGNDGMIMTPEATHVDESDKFVASLFNQEYCEFGLDVQWSDVQSSDVDNFPK